MTQTRKDKQSFIEYLKHGGVPETFSFTKKETISNYIDSLKDSIVLRDIVQRHSIRDVTLLRRIIDFSIDSVGSLLSVNTIVNTLKTLGHKTNVETAGMYFEFLKEAYFLHESPRYDLKGKNILQGEKKFYLNDLSFKYYTTSSFDFAIGKYLENAVYLHYKREGYRIYTGKLPVGEIDFVAEKDNNRLYIQVAYLLSDEDVIEREFGNLDKINDNYEKLVVSLDDVNLGNRKGIKHVNAWELIL
jgi:predicted AAA+ superfamily ATPase